MTHPLYQPFMALTGLYKPFKEVAPRPMFLSKMSRPNRAQKKKAKNFGGEVCRMRKKT
jgi:hypothetical protein